MYIFKLESWYYEYSKLFKRRMDRLAEEEEQEPELEKVEEQPLVALK
jgi:hypothetical protein